MRLMVEFGVIAATAVAATLATCAGCVVAASRGHGLSWAGPANFKATRDVSVEHVAQRPLHVETDNGGITVTQGGTDQVQVTAKVRARSQERLDAVQILAERDSEGALLVHARWPDGKRLSNEGCEFIVSIPDASNLEADTSNGAIAVSGMTCPADLDTSNGGIDVSNHTGDIVAASSNGAIVMDRVTGEVNAQTSNGAIEVASVTGPVTADTNNGSIEVTLAAAAAGPVRLDTSNGNIVLRVGEAFTGKLAAETSNARIRVTTPRAQRTSGNGRDEGVWRFGADGKDSALETSNGGITVLPRGSDT